MKTATCIRRIVALPAMSVGLLTAVCLPIFSLHASAAESDREYCERQQGPARVVCMRDLKQESSGTALVVGPTPSAAPGSVSQADREYCERQQGSARVVCLRQLDKAAATPQKSAVAPSAASGGAAQAAAASSADKAPVVSGDALYKVVNGNQVDPRTLAGFKTWRAAACDRCHGANQEGLVGPSLIESLKTLSKNDFIKTVTHGRLEKGMPSFGTNPTLVANIDNLYAYLKGRSDGAITKPHVVPIDP